MVRLSTDALVLRNLLDAGAVLCSSSYSAQLMSPSPYFSAIKIKLKGFEEVVEILMRMPQQKDGYEQYLQPLLQKINAQAQSG